MNKKYFTIFLIMCFLISIANASNFNMGNPSNSIFNNYAKDSYLGGWINISFNNISSDSIFKDSLNNQIYLTDVLNSPQNSGYNFSCDISSCMSSYDIINPEITKTFYLNQNSTKLVAIGFEENIGDISSISFDIQSTAQKSCSNQIEVDLFDDGTIDYINNQGSGSMCSEIYKGCSGIEGGPGSGGMQMGENNTIKEDEYPGGSGADGKFLNLILGFFNIKRSFTGNVIQTSSVLITETPLCQRIEFPTGPDYEIGAWIKEDSSGTKQFKMDVYNLNGIKIDYCSLSKTNLPQGGSAYLGCDSNFYLIEPEELYVCLSSTSGTGTFSTRGYVPSGQKCAFQGIPPKPEVGAYDIYVRKQEFKSLSNGIKIPNNISNGITFANLVKESIIQNYGSLNCTNGCAIPIRINSRINQNITIKNISIVYQGALGQIESKKMYSVEEHLAKISSRYQKLYLNGFFQLPLNQQSILYNLKLNNELVLEKNITINNLSINISPVIVNAGIPSIFSSQIFPSQNIRKYIWSFGDGSNSIETTNNSITHAYSEIEEYPISLEITTNSNITYYKVSRVNAISPANNLEQIFKDKKENLQKIKNQLNPLDNFSSSKIKEYINLEQTELDLSELESEYNTTTNETRISEIATELIGLPIPDNIVISPQAEKTISIQKEKIDINELSSITGKEINSSESEKYKSEILNWSNSNINTKISANRFDFSVDGIIEEGFSIYNLKIENKGQEKPYLIVDNLNDFDSDLVFSKGTNSEYVILSEEDNQIKISSSENLNVEDFRFFVAPDVLKSSSGNSNISNQGKIKLKDILMYLIIGIGVLVLIIIFYFVYKKFSKKNIKSNFEELFKDRNELYNLTNYIRNARKNGVGDSEIISNLKDAKWNRKQIDYALKEINEGR